MPGPRQYTSLAFTEALLEAGIAGSIGSVGDALDNALMESTIGLYKTELIDRQRSWTGRAEVERETADSVHWSHPPARRARLRHARGVRAGLLRCSTGPTTRGVLTPEDGMKPGTVHTAAASLGSGNVAPHSENGALEAHAMEARSSRAVMIWNSSSAPRGSRCT